jgi:predicted RNA-binding Zn-ribbon protein involved in translation (DUF1610 family)
MSILENFAKVTKNPNNQIKYACPQCGGISFTIISRATAPLTYSIALCNTPKCGHEAPIVTRLEPYDQRLDD